MSDIDLSVLAAASGKPADRLAELPGGLVGAPEQVAGTLLRYRAELGISYISVLEDHMRFFAQFIALLR